VAALYGGTPLEKSSSLAAPKKTPADNGRAGNLIIKKWTRFKKKT
jgi:hypothetical protein